MHRYEELEKLYYKKKFFKVFIFIIFFLLLFVGGYEGYKYLTKKQSVKKTDQHKIKKEKKIPKVLINTNTSKTNDRKKMKHNIQTNKSKKKVKKDNSLMFILPDINMSTKQEPPKKKQNNKNTQKKQQTKKTSKPKPAPKPVPVVVIKEKAVTLKGLIKRFSQKPSYDLAILIAKDYYKKGNLKEAQIWAIKANGLNPQDTQSWLLFADILLKKHNKTKALQILKIYESTYGVNTIIENKIRSINE